MTRRPFSTHCERMEEPYPNYSLYPITACKIEGHLQVSSLYTLYFATYGNPEGIPVIVLHGGSGAGRQEVFLKVFDPDAIMSLCHYV